MLKSNVAKNITLVFLILKLFLGLFTIGITFQMQNKLYFAGYSVFLILLFDFIIDYLHNRFFEIEQQQKVLRSLISVVSLGVAPSMILFILLKNSSLVQQISASTFYLTLLTLLAPFTFAVLTTFRLSKFYSYNDKKKYSGIALQISVLLIASLTFMGIYDPYNFFLFPQLGRNTYFFFASAVFAGLITKGSSVIFLSVFLAAFVVVKLPMFPMRFKNFNFNKNQLQYYFIIISMLLFCCIEALAIPLIFIVYLAFSFFYNKMNKEIAKYLAQ